MRLLTSFFLLISISLSAQKAITDDHINLLGTDIYIKIDQPFLRKSPPSSLLFPSSGLEMLYVQGSDISEGQNMLKSIIDSNVVEKKVLLDDKEFKLYTWSNDLMKSEVKTLYFEYDTIVAFLTFTSYSDKSKKLADDIISSVVIDFEQSLQKSKYYSFTFDPPPSFENLRMFTPGMDILIKKGSDLYKPSDEAMIIISENYTMMEVDLDLINDKILNRDPKTSKYIESKNTKLLIEKGSPIGPETDSSSFIIKDGDFIITGMATYKTEKEKAEIEKYLSSIRKK